MGDFIEHRHRDSFLPKFSPRSQRGMNAGIYRLTVGVQLRNDERAGPSFRRPVRPVSNDTRARFPARRAFTNAFACATVCGSNFTINLLTLVVIAGSPLLRLPGVEKAGATLLF
ncbi:TPA: hypothetical protein ACSC6M_004279 [Enterobacter roggenkampii]